MENKIAYLIKDVDGFHVQELDGTVGPVCNGVTSDGFIKLSPNGAERKYYSVKKAEAHFAESDEPIELTYREPRTGITYGGGSSSNNGTKNVVEFLDEAEATEFAEIVARGEAALADAPVDKEAEIARLNYIMDKAAYDVAIIEGRTDVEEPEKPIKLKKSFIDFLNEADYARYNELVDKATATKKAAVEAKRKAKANSPEAQRARLERNIEKAKAALEKLLAAQDTDATVETDAE